MGIGKTHNLIQLEGIGLASIGLMEEDFNKIELGITFLKDAGFEDDANYFIEEYKELLTNISKDGDISDIRRSEIKAGFEFLEELKKSTA